MIASSRYLFDFQSRDVFREGDGYVGTKTLFFMESFCLLRFLNKKRIVMDHETILYRHVIPFSGWFHCTRCLLIHDNHCCIVNTRENGIKASQLNVNLCVTFSSEAIRLDSTDSSVKQS